MFLHVAFESWKLLTECNIFGAHDPGESGLWAEGAIASECSPTTGGDTRNLLNEDSNVSTPGA